jgi:hypothetical protein
VLGTGSPGLTLKRSEEEEEVQDTDITFMCQTLTSVHIKKDFTLLELSYSVIFPPVSKV